MPKDGLSQEAPQGRGAWKWGGWVGLGFVSGWFRVAGVGVAVGKGFVLGGRKGLLFFQLLEVEVGKVKSPQVNRNGT